MVPRVLRHVPRELRYLDFADQVLLERRIQDLAQTDLEAVHNVRDGPVTVVLREVDHLPVNKLLVCDLGLIRVQIRLAVVPTQPRLSVVRALFIKYLVNRVVARRALVVEHDNLLVLKVLLELGAGTRTQPLVVLDLPSSSRTALLPRVVLAVVVEQLLDPTLLRLEDGRVHEPHEPRDPRQRAPHRLEHIDAQPLDVTAVQILIRHEQDLAVPQVLAHIILGILLVRLQTEDALNLDDLLVLHHLLRHLATNIKDLSTHRVNPNRVAVLGGQPGDNSCLGRVSLTEDNRTLIRLRRTRPVRVNKFGDAAHRTRLLSIALLRGPIVLHVRNLARRLHDAQLRHLLDELVADDARRSELGRRCVQVVLRLTVERRVHYIAPYKQHQLLLDRRRRDRNLFLLLDVRDHLLGDLVQNVVHVLTPLARVYAVYERYMHELVGGTDSDNVLPPLVRLLVDPDRNPIQVDVLEERLHRDRQPVQLHLDAPVRNRGDVVDPLPEELHHILGQSVAAIEPLIVRAEGDLRVWPHR